MSGTCAMPFVVPTGNGGWEDRSADRSRDAVIEWCMSETYRCKHSLHYFVTHYCQTVVLHEPPQTPEIKLVPDWPHVHGLLAALEPPRDIVVEKSRKMLASWLVMATVLHDMLFKRNWPVMTVSRVEVLVDDGGEASTIDTLHGKLRFMWDHLPPFLRTSLVFKYLSVRNPLTNSHVTGFAATPAAGRGPAYRRAILDEFAHTERSEQVIMSVHSACPVGKVLLSTPHGRSNAFYRLRETARPIYPVTQSSTPTMTHWELVRIHWREHPERDDAWRARQSETLTEEAALQELEIEYTKSIGLRVYTRYLDERHRAGAPNCPVQSLDYDSTRPIFLCCDFNFDPLVWEIVQPYTGQFVWRVIDEICRRNAMVEDAVHEFACRYASEAYRGRQTSAWADEYGAGGVAIAGANGHRQPVVIYGDATEQKSTVHNREKTYQEIARRFRDVGFDVKLKVPTTNPPRARRFEVVNDALRNDCVVVSPRCEQLRKDFLEGHWNGQRTDMDQATEDDDGSHLTRSHGSSALGYLLCVVHRPVTTDIAAARKVDRRPAEFLPDFVAAWGR